MSALLEALLARIQTFCALLCRQLIAPQLLLARGLSLTRTQLLPFPELARPQSLARRAVAAAFPKLLPLARLQPPHFLAAVLPQALLARPGLDGAALSIRPRTELRAALQALDTRPAPAALGFEATAAPSAAECFATTTTTTAASAAATGLSPTPAALILGGKIAGWCGIVINALRTRRTGDQESQSNGKR